MSKENISVALAACNGAKFMREQIDSILSQLESGDELVVSYDKSKDDTLNILREYEDRDKRVRVLINHDPGVVGNFNYAINECRNEIIFVCDQDDVWLPNKRQAVVDCFINSNADLVIHDMVQVNASGELVQGSQFNEHNIKSGVLRNFIAPRYSGCCMAFASHMKESLLPLPPRIECYDHWLGMACIVYGRVIFLRRVLLKHRLHDNNVTTMRRRLHVIALQRFYLVVELLKRRRLFVH